MSMNTYPLQEKFGLFLTTELVALINRRDIIDHRPEDVDEETMKLLKSPDFLYFFKDKTSIQYQALMDVVLDTDDAVEAIQSHYPKLEDLLVYCSEFEGTVCFLNPDGTETDRCENFDDDYIAYLQPKTASSYVKQSYPSYDAILDEFKKAFDEYDILMDGFDLTSCLASIDGTYFC